MPLSWNPNLSSSLKLIHGVHAIFQNLGKVWKIYIGPGAATLGWERSTAGNVWGLYWKGRGFKTCWWEISPPLFLFSIFFPYACEKTLFSLWMPFGSTRWLVQGWQGFLLLTSFTRVRIPAASKPNFIITLSHSHKANAYWAFPIFPKAHVFLLPNPQCSFNSHILWLI